MNGISLRIAAATALCFFTQTASAQSAEAPASLSHRAELVRSWRGDADLAAAFFLDRGFGWIVGDRGVVLATADGGGHWTPQESGVECRLRDVWFIDERRGWIVGGRYDTYVHRSRGVVLHTADGGRTWQQFPADLLPALRQIRMLSADEGYALGDASELFPAGLMHTRDGGRTWNAAAGNVPSGVLRGDLVGPQLGLAVAGSGRVLRVAEHSVDVAPLADFGLRSPRDIQLRPDGAGRLVGDGGLVLFTNDGGATWNVPLAGDLATGSGGQCDWQSLAWRGPRMWLVGAPGSVVLHTTDDGATWRPLSTGQTLPLADVTFVDETHGWAVGAMGTILHTADGGQSWRPQSYPARPALLACYTDADAVPAELVAEAAAEQGYRAAAVIVGRRGFEPGERPDPSAADRAADALSALGVSSTVRAWGFPLRQRGIEPPAETLLAAWGGGDSAAAHAYAEAYLVRQLRTWRPDVVLTHDAAPRGDAPARHLWHQLVMQAIDAAADPSRYPEQIELLGLAPWQVQKAFGGEVDQTRGSAAVKTAEPTARLGVALDEFCEPSRALLYDLRRAAPSIMAARLYVNRTASSAAASELFAGLTIPAGGEARRAAALVDGASLVRVRRAAERRRKFDAVVMQKSGAAAAELPAQIRDLCLGLDDEAAGRTIFRLAETLHARGHAEAAAATYDFLLTTRPQHADADAALHRLIRYLASGEADHRLRRTLADLAGGSVANSGDSTAATAARRGDVVLANHESPAAQVPAAAALAVGGAADAGTDGLKVGKLEVRLGPSAPTITEAPSVPTPAARLLGAAEFDEPPPVSSATSHEVTYTVDTPPSPREKKSEPPAANDPAPSPSDAMRTAAAGGTLISNGDDAAARRRRALAVGEYYERRDPAAASDPALAFALASARRAAGQPAEADKFYNHFARTHAADAWWECAAAENAMAEGAAGPKPIHAARRTPSRPKLDGRLDDAAWANAAPLELRNPMGDDASPAAALIAYDEKFLYLAVRCRRAASIVPLQPAASRRRDEELEALDRVDFCFDIDRDYATYYRLTVDCRGHTAESCLGDASWDPQWFVAAGGDGETWIVEAAVAWSELAGEVPNPATVWAAGVQRVTPTQGLQSWSSPAAVDIRPEGFGHLTFQ